MTIFRFYFVFFLIAILGASLPTSWTTRKYQLEASHRAELEKEMHTIRAHNNIDQNVLRLSLIAYHNAKKMGYSTPLLTVVDYTKPSSAKRLWVFDMKNHGKTLFHTWVSHGKNSGGSFAHLFSNNPGSLKSSIGVFMTAEPYLGGHGYSLRIKGLEKGINDHAYNRSVVIHGAPYVNPDNIRRHGQIGRSWGCLAVSPSLSRPLINTLKKSSLVFAYYPDQKWLSKSRFLTG